MARNIPKRSSAIAQSILHVNYFPIRILLSNAVIGRTIARLIETRLGKIYVTPKISAIFSKKSQHAGSASVRKLILSLALNYSGEYLE